MLKALDSAYTAVVFTGHLHSTVHQMRTMYCSFKTKNCAHNARAMMRLYNFDITGLQLEHWQNSDKSIHTDAENELHLSAIRCHRACSWAWPWGFWCQVFRLWGTSTRTADLRLGVRWSRVLYCRA